MYSIYCLYIRDYLIGIIPNHDCLIFGGVLLLISILDTRTKFKITYFFSILVLVYFIDIFLYRFFTSPWVVFDNGFNSNLWHAFYYQWPNLEFFFTDIHTSGKLLIMLLSIVIVKILPLPDDSIVLYKPYNDEEI